MKLTQISPYAWQLTRLGVMNGYLVRESESFTLIDTTASGAAADLAEAARKCGGKIERVLATHAHSDHVGSLDKLAALLGHLQVAIGEREAPLLASPPDKSLRPGEPLCKLKGGFPGVRTPLTHTVNHGELYGSLRCFATPGHTPGHFAYFDERDGTLYAGDALTTMGGQPHISGWSPWLWPLPNWFTWYRPTARRSVEDLLAALDGSDTRLQRIAAGHGQLVTGGRELLEQALREARG